MSKTDLNENNTLPGPNTTERDTDSSVHIIASKFEDFVPETSGDEDLTFLKAQQQQKGSTATGPGPLQQDARGTTIDSSRILPQNVSVAASERLHFSLSKIQPKENETENEDRTFTDDEILIRMGNLSHREAEPTESNNISQNEKSTVKFSRPVEVQAQPQQQRVGLPPLGKFYEKNNKQEDKENVDINRRVLNIPQKKFMIEDSNGTLTGPELTAKMRTFEEIGTGSGSKTSREVDTVIVKLIFIVFLS